MGAARPQLKPEDKRADPPTDFKNLGGKTLVE